MKFNTPAPEDIVRWYRKGVPGGGQRDHIFDRLKAKITGKKAADGTHYFKLHDRQLSDKDADIIIANMKQDEDGYPMLETGSTSGEDERRYQEWIIERYLPVSKAASTEGFTDTTASNEQKEEAVEEEAEEVVEEAEEEVKENIEEAAEVVDEALEDAPIEEPEVAQEEAPDLSDIVDLLPPGMLAAVNQQTGQNYEKTPKTPKSSSSGSMSNKKMLSTLVSSLDAIAGTLSSINVELKKQTTMLGEALGSTVTNLQEIETSHEGLNQKFDAILAAFQAQTAAAEKAIDDAETAADIAEQKGQGDSASAFGFTDTEGKGGRGIGIPDWVKRLFGKAWKRFVPRKLRAITRLYRKRFTKLLSRFAPRNIAKRLVGGLFRGGADAGRRGVGRFVTRKALQVGGRKLAQSAGVRLTQKFIKKAALAFMRPIFKRIPIFGGLIDFAVNLMLGEPVGRAAAKAVGATIGAGLGTLIPIPGVGTIAGGILGDWVGGAMYDAITKTGRPEDPTGASEKDAAAMGAPTSFADQSGGLGAPDVQGTMETGGLTEPGYSVLHGTEAIVPEGTDLLSPIGGALIAASSQFLTQAGPAGAAVAPMFKQTAGRLTKVFDVPATLAQTNVGGSFAGIDSTVKDAKKKEDDYEPRSDYAGEVTEEKVDVRPDDNSPLGMLGRWWNNITSVFSNRSGNTYGGDTAANIPTDFSDVEFGNTDELRFGLTGTTAMAVGGWSHAHFENQDKSQSALIRDTVPVVKKMVAMGMKPETSDARPFTSDMTDQEIGELIKYGSDRHNHSGPKPYAVDINMPGFPLVPVQLNDVRNTPNKGEGINALINGTNTAIFHLSYQSDGYYKGGPVGLDGPEQITVGEEGPEIVMKNLVYEHKPIYEMLSAFNAATTPSDLVSAVETYAPEVLMYDEEAEMDSGSPIVIIQQAPPTPTMSGGSKVMIGGRKKTNATKTLLMQKLHA